jgi:hypothetical protein
MFMKKAMCDKFVIRRETNPLAKWEQYLQNLFLMYLNPKKQRQQSLTCHRFY